MDESDTDNSFYYLDFSLKTHAECDHKGLKCDKNSICLSQIQNNSIIYSCRCVNGFTGDGSYCEG